MMKLIIKHTKLGLFDVKMQKGLCDGWIYG